MIAKAEYFPREGHDTPRELGALILEIQRHAAGHDINATPVRKSEPKLKPGGPIQLGYPADVTKESPGDPQDN